MGPECSPVSHAVPLNLVSVLLQSCGMWQFGTHVYPLLYSSLLTAIVYHAFILLYMDHTGKYEAG